MSDTYTLYTRSNFDGLVCASLLKEIGLIDSVKFVHPKDVQDGKIQLTGNDITASLPYTPEVYIAFDHHSSEAARVKTVRDNYIIEPAAPSSARIIYEYFGGEDRFSPNLNNLMNSVDEADCTNFTKEDIFSPKDWVMLSFITDPRTGLGRFKNFTISNYNLMLKLAASFSQKTIDEIMLDSDVRERVKLYNEEQEKFQEQIQRCTRVKDSIAYLDVRNESVIHAGNRFMVFAMFPECTLAVHEFFGREKNNTVFAVSKSILNKSCSIDIGALMYEFDGGGHMNAGTCQVENERADETLEKIISRIKTLEAESKQEAFNEAGNV